MSSYFFHLKLELYQTPATGSSKRRKLDSISTRSVFVPPPGSDIFKTTLPTHKTSKWALNSSTRKPNGHAIDPLDFQSSLERPDSLQPRTVLSPPTEHFETHGDALLLPERSLRLRKDILASPKIGPTVKQSNEAAATDWRYDVVEIESIDMESSKVKSTSNGELHTKAVYVPSDSRTTEVGWGVVHLYRDTDESSVLGQSAASRKNLRDGGDAFTPEDCTTLCILAVPSWMMPSDLLGFVGDQAREDVSHFRLIRTGRANKYMVLLKFRSAKKALDWQKVNNGRLFSAAEPENCHVVFIRSVEFLSPDTNVSIATNFPHNNHDPFTPASSAVGVSKGLLSKPFAPPPPNLLELPTCPVCLERMDETTGLLTILCQHVFHCACLEKWRGSGCPVCRYTHSPSYTFPYPRPHGESGEREDPEPLCSVCTSTNNLWVCLICGNLGCGRYDEAHAFAHYEETSHCYAMDILTQRVWDYAGDGYVHRLIQSKPAPESSGRSMTDLPVRTRHENEAFRSEGSDSVPREKMENMATEYTYLLTSQLEGQRRYFEEQVERAVDKASEASARAEEAAAASAKAFVESQEARAEQQTMADMLAKMEKALEKSEKTKAKFESMARDMSSQLREEKLMNEGLLKRIKAAEERTEQAQNEAAIAKEKQAEAEETAADLTAFISGQQKVKELQEAGEEVVDGTVGVVEGPKKGKGKGRKR